MDTLIIVVANDALYAVGLAAGLAWLLASRHDKVQLAVAAVVAILALVVSIKLAGALWADPRPFVVDGRPPLIDHAADNGFPSDHTTLATTVAAVLVSVRRRVGWVLLVVAVALGAARVAAHVHHIPDVLGGVALGALSAAVGVLVARRVVAYAVAHGAAGGLRIRPARPRQGQ